MTRQSDLCAYCGEVDAQPPYRFLRDGIPSATTIASTLDLGKASSFAWAASLITATTAVHEAHRWEHLDMEGCTHEKESLCAACKFLRAEFQAQWDAKAALGSHVHHLALSWSQGIAIESDEVVDPYLDAIALFYEERKPSWVLTEHTISGNPGTPLAYRGKFDGIADIACPECEGKRCRWLLDWKTGSYYPAEQTIQMVLYRRAFLTTWEDKAETVGDPVPEVDHAGVVILSPAATYELHALPADDDAWEVAMALRRAWGWGRRMEEWAKAEKERGANV